jgi:hypothetical protein
MRMSIRACLQIFLPQGYTDTRLESFGAIEPSARPARPNTATLLLTKRKPSGPFQIDTFVA